MWPRILSQWDNVKRMLRFVSDFGKWRLGEVLMLVGMSDELEVRVRRWKPIIWATRNQSRVGFIGKFKCIGLLANCISYQNMSDTHKNKEKKTSGYSKKFLKSCMWVCIPNVCPPTSISYNTAARSSDHSVGVSRVGRNAQDKEEHMNAFPYFFMIWKQSMLC